MAATNYLFSIGDSIQHDSAGFSTNPRGIFGRDANISMGSITDGTSNTVMLAEHLVAGSATQKVGRGIAQGGVANAFPVAPASCYGQIDPLDSTLYVGAVNGTAWTPGSMAFCGIVCCTGFNTVLPPNGPACITDAWFENTTILPPSGNHPGGVNVAIGDGSVHFVGDTIDAGDPTLPEVISGRSPYGVWGALGSKDGGEAVSAL